MKHLFRGRWATPARRFPLLLALTAMLTSSLSYQALADRTQLDNTKTQITPELTTAPVIDGVINNDEWQNAIGATGNWKTSYDANYTNSLRGGFLLSGPALADANDLAFQMYAGYDTNYLYIAVRVTDSILFDDTAAADSANGNTWEDDSVEVFVDGLNANDAAWSTNNPGGQYVITINNAYRENEAGNPGYGTDKAWYAKATRNEAGTGYDAEFRISLKTLGNPKDGDIIGFTVAVNDDDSGGAIDNATDRQVTWVGAPHKPVTYGNLVLGHKLYNAPKVAQAPTIDGKINATEYAGAQEIPINTTTSTFQSNAGGDTWPPGDLEGKAWVVHDANAVYVAVDVTDDIVVTDTAEALSEDGNTWEDDSVEVFFDMDVDRNHGGPTVDFEGQYVLTANAAHRDAEARNPTFGENDHWFGAASKTTKGYQVEFKITKAALTNPADNALVGFNLGLNDDDGAGRKAQLNWDGDPHQEYTYGELRFALAAVTAPIKFSSIKANANGSLTLEWAGGGTLQTASALAGPWADVAGAASPYTFTPTGKILFGRIKK